MVLLLSTVILSESHEIYRALKTELHRNILNEWNHFFGGTPTLMLLFVIFFHQPFPPFQVTYFWNGHCPANIYLFKVNNKNTRKRCEICSKLTIKTPERRHWGGSGVFTVNFEHISHLFLEYLLLTLNKQVLTGKHFSKWFRKHDFAVKGDYEVNSNR